MPKPGDRVVIEGTKVGGGRREGTLLGMAGTLIRVRWEDGIESYMAPAAGAVRFFPGSSKAIAAASRPKPKAKMAKPAAKAKRKR